MSIGINEFAKIGKIELPKIENNNDGTVFDDMYKAAINLIDETNQIQKNADQMSIDFALGKVDSIHNVMIAQEKANLALQYTVQLRNSILDAYNEIMRMQV